MTGMAFRDPNFAPLGFRSELIERDITLLHEQFQVPSSFQLEVLGLNNRVCQPPPSRMSLYEECFQTGLRLVLHPFFMALL